MVAFIERSARSFVLNRFFSDRKYAEMIRESFSKESVPY